VTLDRFDYTQENYVSVLWFCEGATAYYDEYLCWRAGFYDTKRYLTLLSEAITRLETTPGKDIQPLTQSSFDAWIKLYRPDENSLNSSISYYLKGHIVIWLLNLHLIAQGRGSFDRVMQLLWQKFQHQPYTEPELWATIEECAGEDLTSFYKDYISGTTPLPYAEMLTPLGLTLTEELSPFPYTGLRIGEDKPVLRTVDSNSPAQQAGLAPGDELVALNGWRVLPRAKDLFKSCEAVQVSFFRREELLQTTLTPTSPRPARYVLAPLQQRSPQQEANYQAWINPQ